MHHHYSTALIIRSGQQHQDSNAQNGDASQSATKQGPATPDTGTASTAATTKQQIPPPGRNWLLNARSKLKKAPYPKLTTIKNRVGKFTNSARTMLQQHTEDGEGILDNKERFLSALGPSLVAVWANRGGANDPQRLLSITTIYALSLLGASVGFHSFLYFISVGYALGVILPVAAVLSSYIRLLQNRNSVKVFLGRSSLLHSCLVLVWGLRALSFFLWREYINWPALHKQIRHVNKTSAPALPVKCLIWVMYSFLYTAMLSPCWLRLRQSARLVVQAPGFVPTTTGLYPFRWIAIGLPILLQLLGLAMESIADYQKSAFKLQNRYEWCNIGLWKWSTHPNYLGEMIFWTGTYLGWLLFSIVVSKAVFSTLSPSFLSRIGQFFFCTLGYGFILTVLRGSIQSMSNKHWQKYGHLPEYAIFRQSHGLVGPKRRSHTAAHANEESTAGQPQPQDEAANPATSANAN